MVIQEMNQILDLLQKMLIYHPEKRITAEEAIDHPFFNDIRYVYD